MVSKFFTLLDIEFAAFISFGKTVSLASRAIYRKNNAGKAAEHAAD
jgi:hypothetical protein